MPATIVPKIGKAPDAKFSDEVTKRSFDCFLGWLQLNPKAHSKLSRVQLCRLKNCAESLFGIPIAEHRRKIGKY